MEKKSTFTIRLRALELDDFKNTLLWRNDETTADLLGGQKRYVSSETEKRWIEQAIKDHEDGKILRFAITINEVHTIVGMITISEIDYVNRSCSYSNILQDDLRGKGIALPARIKVFRYVYDELGMNRIEGRILESNTDSRKFAEKFGMKLEGILRDKIYKNGKFQNLLIYSILREEFYSRYGSR
jgi:[ribosomal protein S5]-alanine N-acetyltransferase